VVCEDLAVLTRPGAAVRRPEVDGVAEAVRSLGLRTARIEEPGTLDGGDVLQAGGTVYAGRGVRTNGEGIRQLRALLAPLGRTVIGVPLGNVLHLKSAVTALPDGTFLLLPGLVPAELFPAVRPVAEEGGSHVVPLGGDRVLIAASAPRTAGSSRTWASRRSSWTSASSRSSKAASPVSACCCPDGSRRLRPPGSFSTLEPMHVVGMVLHPERTATGAVGSILEWAAHRDIQVLGIDTEISRLACTAEAVTATELRKRADLLVSLGGDGTMLRAMRLADGHSGPRSSG